MASSRSMPNQAFCKIEVKVLALYVGFVMRMEEGSLQIAVSHLSL